MYTNVFKLFSYQAIYHEIEDSYNTKDIVTPIFKKIIFNLKFKQKST